MEICIKILELFVYGWLTLVIILLFVTFIIEFFKNWADHDVMTFTDGITAIFASIVGFVILPVFIAIFIHTKLIKKEKS